MSRTLQCFAVALFALFLRNAPVHAQWWGTAAKSEDKKDGTPAKDKKGPDGKIRNAERITRLQLTMQQDKETRDKLKTALDKATEEVRKASADLSVVEGGLAAKNKLLAKADLAGEEKTILQGEIKDLVLQKEVGAEGLELAIRQRKLLQERLAVLDRRLLESQASLDALANDDGKDDPAFSSDPKIAKAREEARRRDEKAREAEMEKKSLEQRIRAMEEFLFLEQGLLESDKKKLNLGSSQLKILEEEKQLKVERAAPAAEIEAVNRRIDALSKRQEDIRAGIKEREERTARLQQSLTASRGEKVLVDQEATVKKTEADKADADLKKIENPLNPRNILRWVVEHGPRILLMILAMFSLRFLVRSLSNRLINFMTHRHGKDPGEERENRARTLASVFHNFGMVLVYGGGSLMLLEEIGIPVIPLMGGAAILGLAVAFGAQNLVKDYFYGFVILLENQYTVNDVVRIGTIAGTVERISLRMTTLRDLEGVVHFIPHGQVTTVSNLTHGWSRILFEIGVSYNENVDRVMEVLLQIGREMRRDPHWDDQILEEMEMLGVDKISDSAVVLKFLMKTKPLQRWKVKREMMRRIKKTFDELHISTPASMKAGPPTMTMGTEAKAKAA